ncbi:hypothetical protein JZU48_02955, partial [bacterium]|nr:hypothetical protein [bacterium]
AESMAERSALLNAGGVKARAARLLGISRGTLYERMAALGMTGGDGMRKAAP